MCSSGSNSRGEDKSVVNVFFRGSVRDETKVEKSAVKWDSNDLIPYRQRNCSVKIKLADAEES